MLLIILLQHFNHIKFTHNIIQHAGRVPAARRPNNSLIHKIRGMPQSDLEDEEMLVVSTVDNCRMMSGEGFIDTYV